MENPENSHNSDDIVQLKEGNANADIHLKDETASQLLDLLSEIKDCDGCVLEPNFHPCPWCSGKLITV